MNKEKLEALFILFIFVQCLFVGQRAKGVIETQKWANNKRAEGVVVIPCNWLLRAAKEEESFKK